MEKISSSSPPPPTPLVRIAREDLFVKRISQEDQEKEEGEEETAAEERYYQIDKKGKSFLGSLKNANFQWTTEL